MWRLLRYDRLRMLPPEDGGKDSLGREIYFEWTLGPAHCEMDDEVFARAWVAFFHALKKG